MKRAQQKWLVWIGGLFFLLAACVQSPKPLPSDSHDLIMPNIDSSWSLQSIRLFPPGQHQATTLKGFVKGSSAFVEGDIHLSLNPKVSALSGVNVAVSTVWPGGVIPYTIEASVNAATRTGIASAINEWQSKTAIRWVPRSNQTNYVAFTSQQGCWSEIGMVGGKQEISIQNNDSAGSGCNYMGIIAHEMGHAAGLWHEQTRNDRDSYVDILFDNITPGYEFNFMVGSFSIEDYGLYDYGSIMHYGAKAFSRNGKPTIVPKDPTITIGQRNGLSAGDIAGVTWLMRARPLASLENLSLLSNAPSTFRLSNVGTASATFNLSSSNPAITLNPASVVIDGGKSTDISVQTSTCPASGTLTINGPVSTDFIEVSAVCEAASFAADPASLTLPAGEVGGTVSSGKLHLSNLGGIAANYSVSSDNPAITVSPASGNLAAVAGIDLTVSAQACTALTPTTATLTINGAGDPLHVGVSRACLGTAAWNLSLDGSHFASSLSQTINQTLGKGSSEIVLSVRNVGTAAGNISLISDQPWATLSPASFSAVAVGSTVTAKVTLAACTTTGSSSALIGVGKAQLNLTRVCLDPVAPPPTTHLSAVTMSTKGQVLLAWAEIPEASGYNFRATFAGAEVSISGDAPNRGGSYGGAVAAFVSNPDAPSRQGLPICLAIQSKNSGGTSEWSSYTCTPYRYFDLGATGSNPTQLWLR